MEEKAITYKQGVSLIVLFLTGSSIIFTPAKAAKQDIWLAIVLAMLFVLPLLFIYERLIYIFPDKDLFDILQITFGKGIGKIVSILYVWFSFHLGSLVLNNFGDFISVIGLTETPKAVPVICIALLCILSVKYGIKVVGRWGELAAVLVAVSITTATVLLIDKMDINNLKPMLYNGIKPVLKGTFSTFAFPFGELVIFTMVFNTFKEKGVSKVYRKGLLLGGIPIFITSLREVLVLGVNIAEIYYFPANAAARRIDIGDFIQRIEILISLVFLIGGITKVSMCLLATSKGIAKLFNLKDYRAIVTPIGIMMVNLTILSYESVMEMSEWTAKVWPYYSFLFQAILPIIIFVCVEVKRKMMKNI